MKFRSQILAKLSAKHPGLSKQLLGLIADKLAAKVTEETEIEGAITALDDSPISIQDYATFLQRESDRRVTEALNKPKPGKEDEEEDEDEPEPTKQPAKGKKKDDDPIAKLTGLVTTLTQQVTNMQQAGVKKTFAEKLNARLAEKKIPALLAKGRTVESDEDVETAMAEIESDHETYKQDLLNQGLGGGKPPVGGVGGDVTQKKVEADIGSWADKHKLQDPQTPKK